jgi:hypothetical protein
MNGFAVISKANDEDVKNKFPVLSKVWGMDKIMLPYTEKEFDFNSLLGAKINITEGFEGAKVKRAYKAAIRQYGHVLSKEYNINYNILFHHSCLIRALDFYTVKKGCDLRLSEVVIADAATVEGRNAFRLLMPIARRILLVTENKNSLSQEVEYAMNRFGISAAVIEDPVKASEKADALVLSSQNPDHKYLANLQRPMLYFNFLSKPLGKMWFDDVGISYSEGEELESLYAQGYLDAVKKEALWHMAEDEGFVIRSLKKENKKIIER